MKTQKYRCPECGTVSDNLLCGCKMPARRIIGDRFPSLLQSAEDERREELNESDSFADSYYSLRDEGRNPDGSGESYAERNT